MTASTRKKHFVFVATVAALATIVSNLFTGLIIGFGCFDSCPDGFRTASLCYKFASLLGIFDVAAIGIFLCLVDAEKQNLWIKILKRVVGVSLLICVFLSGFGAALLILNFRKGLSAILFYGFPCLLWITATLVTLHTDIAGINVQNGNVQTTAEDRIALVFQETTAIV